MEPNGVDTDAATSPAAWELRTRALDYTTARYQAEQARLAMYPAIQAAAEAGIPETEIASIADIDRMTVRKALGKTRPTNKEQ